MRLTTVGTGTAAAHPARVQSGSLVEAGEARLLVDCGSGVLWRMAQLGIRWQDITHVVLTHFHADHTTDLVNLLTAWRYGQLPPRETPVTIVGPEGTSGFFDRLAAAFAPDLATFVPGLRILELRPHTPLTLGGSVELECCRVPHTAESVAWAVTEGGTRLVCSGDTGWDESFASWAAGCDLLLLECSLPSSLGMPLHLTPETCAEVAARARPRQVLLNHFYPPVETVDIEGIIAMRYGGPIRRAYDGHSQLVTGNDASRAG